LPASTSSSGLGSSISMHFKPKIEKENMLTILNPMLEFLKQIHICLLCCVENKDDKNHKPAFFPNSMYSNHFCRTFSRLYFTGLCNVYIDSFTESEKETVSEQFIHETNNMEILTLQIQMGEKKTIVGNLILVKNLV
jgi:hypothetical protein